MVSKKLKLLQSNIKVGDILVCQYYNSADKEFYGEFFEVSVMAIKVDTYTPVRDFVGVLNDGRIITLWRKEIKGEIK